MTFYEIQALRDQRGQIAHQMKAMVDAAEKEKRGFTESENETYDKLYNDQQGLLDRIGRLEKQEALNKELNGEPAAPVIQPATNQDALLIQGFRGFILHGKNYAGPGHNEFFNALQADQDSKGGYLVPQQIADEIIKAVDDMVFIRQLATVHPLTGADSLGIPSLDNDPADADWTGEITSVGEDSTMSFGKRELSPSLVSKLIRVSMKLLRKTAAVETLVRDRLAYKFAVTHEKAFLTGTGSGQPLGVFVASSNGISTSRDISTDNTTTEIKADNLINVKYTLKGQYWPRAQWIFHRDAMKQISKLKDGDGQYLWRPGLVAGEPEVVLQMPINMSEHAPNTFTTGLYVGILGDFSAYHIADSHAMEIQRVDELYAGTNQVGFIGRLESDGMPVLEEAFVRSKLG